MPKQPNESIRRFLEKLKRPKREQSEQQTTSSIDRARQAALDALNEKRRQWLEKQKAKRDAKNQGES